MTGKGATYWKPNVIPEPTDGQAIYGLDPGFKKYHNHLEYRTSTYRRLRGDIDILEGGLDKFSQGYKTYGFTRSDGAITYREWAPGATVCVGDGRDGGVGLACILFPLSLSLSLLVGSSVRLTHR